MRKLNHIQNSTGDVPTWLTNELKSRIRNASRIPKVYYGMHFSEGVAEYREDGQAPYRVFINESTAKKMDPSFEGCPLVVLHTEEELKEILPNIMEKADGFVIESFFNQADGKHWAKFLAITDAAHEAIAKGWFLSNCYKIKQPGRGGMWHGVDFKNEVLEGKYEHLAIVPNPRYESKIMTPEEFKAYNDEKKSELAERLVNSNDNQGDESMLFFTRKKLENSTDLENTMVELPKSKKQMSLKELVNAQDAVENMSGYASDDHMVKLNDSEEMSVKDLKSKYNEMVEKSKATEEAAEGEGDADADAAFNEEDEGEEEADADASMDNAADEEEEIEGLSNAEKALLKKINAKKKVANAASVLAAQKAKKAAGKGHFQNMSNAADRAALKREQAAAASVYDSERAQMQRGQDRYGSAKK